ncbi:hypothetical protein SERLA73DRAFT_161082 [Serpula lacrymans var. lacrymans S7.3]|uniref:Uncharacterized protein n=1 Tax=Serpula lacrymans var. lacrymans (strain S7.3) TaxID=936435 RepID=F8Q1L7_SERL3|nr:hypothetical protein SERLA73DRAFT_161082 [Serpula lacrymans var. lacrymans S7.3]
MGIRVINVAFQFRLDKIGRQVVDKSRVSSPPRSPREVSPVGREMSVLESSHAGDVDVKSMVARSHSVDARNAQFNQVHGDDGYQVNNETHGPQMNQQSNSADTRYDRFFDNDIHDRGYETNNENRGPHTNQPSDSVDARYGKFNEVYGNGYQINNDVHNYQTNQTTINHYTQDNVDSLATLKELQEFANWLSPLNFRQRQSEVRETWREGTGGWVLDDERFKEWQRGDVKTLWCPGIPGAGKTVLASYIINHLEKDKKDKVAVVYAYCSYNDRSRQTACNLVASLLKQLVQDFPLTFGRIKDKFKRHREQDFRPTLSEVFIVVDALDEVTEDHDTRSETVHCLQSLKGSFLVTSRDMSSVEAALHEALRMDIRAHADDVRNYITDRIHLQTQLDGLLGDALRREVIERLTKESQGMFLLSRLHVDLLAHKLTRNEVRRALDNLPKEVGSAYDETMKRIDEGRHRELAKAVMTWIVFASRALFFMELQEALALSTGLRKISADDLMAKAIIMDACAGLLVVDGDVCRLVHYSVQEYLVKRGDWAFPDPQAQIVKICFNALSMFSPKEVHPGDVSHSKEFVAYARQNWGHHTRNIEETIPTVIREFLGHDKNVENALQPMYGPESRYFDGELARLLVKNFVNFNINWKDQSGFTPLWIATWHGDEKTVEFLLTCGRVDVNMFPTESSVPPLWAAAYRAFSEMDEILDTSSSIYQGVNSNDINGGKSNDLQSVKNASLQQGNEAVLRLLLERSDVDVNWKNKNGETLLSVAAKNGSKSLVKKLLSRHDIDANLQDNKGDSPMHHAVHFGHKEVAALLEARDDVVPNLKNVLGQTPCSVVSQDSDEQKLLDACTQEAMVELLPVQASIPVDSDVDNGSMPLMLPAVKPIEQQPPKASHENEVTALVEAWPSGQTWSHTDRFPKYYIIEVLSIQMDTKKVQHILHL